MILTAAIAVYLAGRLVSPALRTLPWSLALTLLAVATLALRLATLSDYSHQVQRVTLLTTGSLRAVALLGVGVPVVVLAARALRRLPPVSGNTRMPTTPIG